MRLGERLKMSFTRFSLMIEGGDGRPDFRRVASDCCNVSLNPLPKYVS